MSLVEFGVFASFMLLACYLNVKYPDTHMGTAALLTAILMEITK